MYKKDACVKSKYGIHARPSAAIVVNVTKNFPETEVTIINSNNGRQADAKSVLEIMFLALPYGSIVTVSASGKDEEKAVNAVVKIIETFEVEVK